MRGFPKFELNPVFSKEVEVYERSGATSSRRASALAFAVGLAVLLLLSLMLAFPGSWRFSGHGMGLLVLAGLAFSNYAVLVPAAASVALERDRKTFEALTVSPLRPEVLVRGKILSAVSLGVLVKAHLLPAVALTSLVGGIEPRRLLIYLAVLLAVDVCYACFGVLVSSRLHRARNAAGIVKAPTQAQLALQKGLGLPVLLSIGLVYAIALAIPMSLKNGFALTELAEQLRLLGMLHPQFCLLLWGPVRLFGEPVPLWLLCIVFHLLFAAMLYAQAVAIHKPPCGPRTRLPRSLGSVFIAALAISLCGATWEGSMPTRLLVTSLFALASTLFATMALSSDEGGVELSRAGLLAAFRRPTECLRSHPLTAPAFLAFLPFAHGLAFAPVLLSGAAPVTAELVASLCGLSLLCASFACHSSRAAAERQRHAAERIEAQLKRWGSGATAHATPPADREPDDPKGRSFALGLLLFTSVLPALALIALEAQARGSIQLPTSFSEGLRSMGATFLSLNPISCFSPLLGSSEILGHDAIEALCSRLSVTPGWLHRVNLLGSALLLAVSLLRYPRPASTAARLEAAVRSATEASAPQATPS